MAYMIIGDCENALERLNRAIEIISGGEPDTGFWNLQNIRNNINSDPILERAEFVEVRSRLGFRE